MNSEKYLKNNQNYITLHSIFPKTKIYKKSVLITMAFFIVTFSVCFSQSKEALAEAYTLEAWEALDEKSYAQAMLYCDKVENALGDDNAEIQLIRVICFFEQERLLETKLALDRFATYPASEDIMRKMAPYIVKIDEALEQERAKQQALRNQQVQNNVIENMTHTTSFKEGVSWIKFNNKYGLLDSNQNALTDFKYDKVNEVSDGFFEVCIEKITGSNVKLLCGYIDANGYEVIPIAFNKTTYFNKYFILVETGTDSKLIDHYGNIIFENVNYEEFYPVAGNPELLKVKYQGKYGFISNKGIVLLPVQYDEIELNEYDLALIKTSDSYGAINMFGIMVLPTIYSKSSDIEFYPEIIKVKHQGKYGVFNHRGIELLQTKYDEINLTNGFLVIRFDGKYGLFDIATGKELLNIEYDEIDFNLYEEYACIIIKKDGKLGFVDNSGKTRGLIKYDQLDKIHGSDYMKVYKDNRYGMVDLNTLNEIIPPEYDIIYYNNDFDAYQIIKSSQFGLFNQNTSSIVIPAEYEKIIIDEIDYTEEEKQTLPKRFKVTQNAKTGIIDFEGKVLFMPKYDEIRDWNNKYAAVRIDQNWSFINSIGKEITKFIYEDAGVFKELCAPVKQKNKWGYIGTNGQLTIDLKYDEARSFNNGYAAVKKGKKWGYINKKGDEIIKSNFDFVQDMEYDASQNIWIAKVNRGNKNEVIRLNSEGKQLK